MSRELPRFPNLEHLRNQAKVLLGELRQLAPNAKLSDAQRVLARQYGFPSWPKLKTHVGQMDTSHGGHAGAASARAALEKRMKSMIQERTGAGAIFVRFTEAARKVVFFSRYEAHLRGSDTIDPGHLLLGLMRGDDDLMAQTFARSGLSMDEVRAQLEPRMELKAESSGDMPISPEARLALKRAAEEANLLEHREIQTPHILLGLLHDEGTVAGSVLIAGGMRLDRVRKDVGELIGPPDGPA